jgi:type III secretion system YseE family protein
MLQQMENQNNQQAITPQQAEEQRNEMVKQLAEAVNEVTDEMNKGLQPAEYQKAEKLLYALKAAIEVVQESNQPNAG